MWDLYKIRVKKFSIQYGIQAAKLKKNAITEIEKDIDDLDQTIAKNPNDNELIEQRVLMKQQYDTLCLENVKGAQIRSRLQWAEKGEKYIFLSKIRKQPTNCKYYL